jgi:hypothetical protein
VWIKGSSHLQHFSDYGKTLVIVRYKEAALGVILEDERELPSKVAL